MFAILYRRDHIEVTHVPKREGNFLGGFASIESAACYLSALGAGPELSRTGDLATYDYGDITPPVDYD